jgi:citrate lyase subunit gamma (acyl carrier protein)
MKTAISGSIESNDCLITVEESDRLELIIESIVYDQFHHLIEKVIISTLNELGISNIKVYCNDKGALDYTIKSRLVTAIRRLKS